MKTKVIAEFTKWNGEKEEHEIEREWIDDIVFAVEAQMFVSIKDKFSIQGGNFSHVDIYEVVA